MTKSLSILITGQVQVIIPNDTTKITFVFLTLSPLGKIKINQQPVSNGHCKFRT